MADVPFRAAGEDDFAFDGGAAGFAPGGKEFVEVEVAVEAGEGVVGGVVGWLVLFLVFFLARGVGVGGFRVESDEFEVGGAGVAGEAGRVETLVCGAEDAACDGEGAGGAEGVRVRVVVGWREVGS